MKRLSKLIKVFISLLTSVLLLVGSDLILDVLTTPISWDDVAQAKPGAVFGPHVSSALIAYTFSDEFNGSQLDATKWDKIRGNPTVNNGKLTLLATTTTKAEIQSKALFQSSVLQMVIESANWKPQNQFTDSSFGFEIWTGANGQCHYGVVFVASGHLGILHPQPDVNNNCFGDPQHQVYVPITNWEAVRAAGKIFITLKWSFKGVTLDVSNDGSIQGRAVYTGQANPTVPLEIRLNTDTNETYHFDSVRVNELEEESLLVDDFTPQPRQGEMFWPHNRLGGDRGSISGSGSGSVIWGKGVVTATISDGTNSSRGAWTSLNHPILDCVPLNFVTIFPPAWLTNFTLRSSRNLRKMT